MAFIVLEGFSGTGKTTLARELEVLGWLRLTESAHAVPESVPVAARADTFADYSLLGATMTNLSAIKTLRPTRNIVSEGYLLSDLAYAKIRFELGKSEAYPAMASLCRRMLESEQLRPDLYVLLRAKEDTLEKRLMNKSGRERNDDEFFRTRYYTALAEIHEELKQTNVERVFTDADPKVTLAAIVERLKQRKLVEA